MDSVPSRAAIPNWPQKPPQTITLPSQSLLVSSPFPNFFTKKFKNWTKTWNIGNASFRVLEPLIEERLENDRDAWEAVYSGAGLGVIHLPGIAEGWSREVAIRIAEVLMEVARMVSSGDFDLYEYESFERELETREKFARLIILLDEFLEKWDAR